MVSILSNQQIKAAIKSKHIVCHPFNPKHISQASLDVTLGYYFFKVEQANERNVYNPFDPEDVESYFDGPYRAISHQKWCDFNGIKSYRNIPLEHPIIAIKPGERILAHTHEFVGIKPPGGCDTKSRSSWGRNGVAVCFYAGWIDPGYTNRITLEIYNLNQRETVLLPVGERIAQLVFHETGPVDGSYGDGRDGGFSSKYQQGAILANIIRTWSPDQMLPKAYLDKRQLPQKIEGLSYD